MKRKDYGRFFMSAPRVDGNPFYKLRDDAPEDLTELIRRIHFDHFDKCLPNDWIYEQIMDAFEDLERDPLENINIQADDWTGDLIRWLQNSYALWICDDERDDSGSEGTIHQQIEAGQIRAKQMIYDAVNKFIGEETEE